MFQSSTTNAQTQILAIPNGTSTQAVFEANSDSSGGTNAVIGQIGVISGAEVRITSGIRGTGTYQPMTLHTGGSERVRIDTSGNVGIGTSSPLERLHVAGGPALVTGTLSALRASSTAVDFSGGAGRIIAIGSDASTVAPLIFGNASTANFSERMRIDSSGNLLVGAASGAGRLHVKTAGNTGADWGAQILNSDGTILFAVLNNGQLYTGSGTYNGTTGSAANVFIDADNGLLRRSTSSLRYKTNVQDSTHGLAAVMALRPVTYKGKNDGDKVFGGLIAEEVDEAGLTEFVVYDSEGRPDALHYGNMVALAFKAIQELNAKVDAQAAEIAALKGAQ
jgi:hypothetical protein